MGPVAGMHEVSVAIDQPRGDETILTVDGFGESGSTRRQVCFGPGKLDHAVLGKDGAGWNDAQIRPGRIQCKQPCVSKETLAGQR